PRRTRPRSSGAPRAEVRGGARRRRFARSDPRPRSPRQASSGRRYTRPPNGAHAAASHPDMFDTLTDRLDGVFSKLRRRGKLHPKQVDNALAEVRVALLEADVAVDVADDLLERVRTRSLSEEVLKSLTPAQQVVKIMNEELTVTLGGEHRP